MSAVILDNPSPTRLRLRLTERRGLFPKLIIPLVFAAAPVAFLAFTRTDVECGREGGDVACSVRNGYLAGRWFRVKRVRPVIGVEVLRSTRRASSATDVGLRTPLDVTGVFGYRSDLHARFKKRVVSSVQGLLRDPEATGFRLSHGSRGLDLGAAAAVGLVVLLWVLWFRALAFPVGAEIDAARGSVSVRRRAGVLVAARHPVSDLRTIELLGGREAWSALYPRLAQSMERLAGLRPAPVIDGTSMARLTAVRFSLDPPQVFAAPMDIAQDEVRAALERFTALARNHGASEVKLVPPAVGNAGAER